MKIPPRTALLALPVAGLILAACDTSITPLTHDGERCDVSVWLSESGNCIDGKFLEWDDKNGTAPVLRIRAADGQNVNVEFRKKIIDAYAVSADCDFQFSDDGIQRLSP